MKHLWQRLAGYIFFFSLFFPSSWLSSSRASMLQHAALGFYARIDAGSNLHSGTHVSVHLCHFQSSVSCHSSPILSKIPYFSRRRVFRWLSSWLSCRVVRWKFTDVSEVLPVTYRPSGGGSKHLWKVGRLAAGYTAQQPRREPSSNTSLFLLFISSLGAHTVSSLLRAMGYFASFLCTV
jgi:hypothetical protein